MWVYELHDIWEERAASIFGVVVTRVVKYSGNEAGQSFKMKEGSRQSVASRSGKQAVSTMLGFEYIKHSFWLFEPKRFASQDRGVPWKAEEFWYEHCYVFTWSKPIL
jgi:hypothetical protein